MTKTAKVINLKTALKDRSYRWNDRDPDLEWVCNEITASGLSTIEISREIYRATGTTYTVSPSTMDKWLAGKVRRPQNMTLSWVAYGLGYQRRWIKL